jgi:hypothetical protein
MRYKLLLVFAIFTSCRENNTTNTPTNKIEEIKKVEYKIVCDTIDVFDLDQKNGNIKFSKEVVCDTILING